MRPADDIEYADEREDWWRDDYAETMHYIEEDLYKEARTPWEARAQLKDIIQSAQMGLESL